MKLTMDLQNIVPPGLETDKEILSFLMTNIRDRRSGRTTRLIDSFVQEFFTTGKTSIHDHYSGSAWPHERKRVFGIFVRRLEMEHGMQFGVKVGRFVFRDANDKAEIDTLNFQATLLETPIAQRVDKAIEELKDKISKENT